MELCFKSFEMYYGEYMDVNCKIWGRYISDADWWKAGKAGCVVLTVGVLVRSQWVNSDHLYLISIKTTSFLEQTKAKLHRVGQF
jgi:hypothetical protein